MAHGYEKPAVCTRRHDNSSFAAPEQKPPLHPRSRPRPRPALNTESTGDYDNKSPTRNETCGTTASGIFGSCWHGFPPGLTVDGLCQFRRRPPGYLKPQDNLKPEGESIRKYRSEYKRCFQGFQPLSTGPTTNGEITTEQPKVKEISPTRYRYRPLDSFRLEYQDQETALLPPQVPRSTARGQIQTHLKSSIIEGQSTTSNGLSHHQMPPVIAESEQHEKFKRYEGIHRPQLARRASSIPREKTQLADKSSEVHAKYVHHADVKRANLVRRPTSLSMEGELLTKTEKADKFIKFLLSKRPGLVKKPTTLKLEGDMNINTEAREKFLPLDITKRPPLAKKETNLHLEGDIIMEPEYKKKFTKFDVQERPTLAKRDTNLRLEGELELDPEYREVYVEFPIERVTPSKPVPNLKPEGELIVNGSETTSKFIEHSLENLKPVKLIRHSTNLQLEGTQEFNPDYRDSYKSHDLHNLRSEIIKQPTNLNLQGNIEFKPDYRESYVVHNLENLRCDYVRNKPNLNLEGVHEFSPGYRETYTTHKLEKTEMKRPEDNLKSPEGKLELISESSEKFKEHERVKRPDMIKEVDNILLEGKIDMNPEYKNAFIDFPRSRPVVKKPVPEMTKPIDDIIKKKRIKGEGVHSQNGVATLKTEGKLETSPEYKSSFVDFPRERPVVVKPEPSLKAAGEIGEVEKQSPTKRISPTKRVSQIKLTEESEPRFECQPEYRRAYIDYIKREQIERIRPPMDNLSCKENIVPGIHRKVGEKQDKAFEVLCTKGTGSEEKRLGPVKLKVNDEIIMNGDIPRSPKRSILKPLQDRSPSPGYRVQIQTDEHKVGFRIRRRRSQDIRPTPGRHQNNVCKVSSISSDRNRRFISPSTTSTSPVRRKRWNGGNRVSRKDSARKAFVVLSDSENAKVESQNNNDENLEDQTMKKIVKRASSTHGVPKEERANWMPPWYDAPI